MEAASCCLKEASDTGKATTSVVPNELPSKSPALAAEVRSVVKSFVMTLRISAALAGVVLAALGLFARAPQTQPKATNTIEAARQNNLGSAYMNQQLFEKGLRAFQQAVELDPKLAIARLNEAIAFLNLQKVDEAKAALEAALKPNRSTWPTLMAREFCSPRSMARSSSAVSVARFGPIRSRLPERISASNTRRFTRCKSMRRHKSGRLSNGPLAVRSSMMASTAEAPTPLMAPSPKRMLMGPET